eukprot:736314-Amphidinium_carterae.1
MKGGWLQGLATSPLGMELALAPLNQMEYLRDQGLTQDERDNAYLLAWFHDLQAAQPSPALLRRIAEAVIRNLLS